QFSPEISSRICKHMNEDHANAIVIYAQAFGKSEDATAAEMLSYLFYKPLVIYLKR
ncbi:MAG: DUF2470 domain-containing protein, partial [Sphaerospermopsis sp. SIO1G2]|nr:DUF2470 domain-containing protein [Sphaerospermopsis sp. SIO1G2]